MTSKFISKSSFLFSKNFELNYILLQPLPIKILLEILD